mgnify:FL=1
MSDIEEEFGCSGGIWSDIFHIVINIDVLLLFIKCLIYSCYQYQKQI